MQHTSIVGMIWNAGPMVKFVMLLLLTFSGMSWYIIFSKFLLYKKVRQESEEFVDEFWRCRTLSEAGKAADNTSFCPEAEIYKSGYAELQKLSKSRTSTDTDDTFERRLASMENLKRTIQKTGITEIETLGKALPLLATTGSATPFIGLFGTVWGIMESFQEIGVRGSASLAVVAPGISEALIATAAGLAVAIPAVVFFNFFSNQLAEIENKMQSFASDFLNLVERDLIAKIQ